MRLRFTRGTSAVYLAAIFLWMVAAFAGPTAYAEPPPAQLEPGEQAYFHYPLRAGESLNDVARIFRVPVQQLAELNQIRDINRLQLGQVLRVPDGFAAEAAELRADRDRLQQDKQRIQRESEDRQRTIAGLETEVAQLQAERDALNRELAANVRWHKAAMALAFLCLGASIWALQSRFDRIEVLRRRAALVAENAALSAAKERYRQAASHLELRYQNLYSKKNNEPISVVVADGITRISHAFAEGSAEVERLLAQLKGEREQLRRLLESEERTRAWLFHPVRELLDKYHTP